MILVLDPKVLYANAICRAHTHRERERERERARERERERRERVVRECVRERTNCTAWHADERKVPAP